MKKHSPFYFSAALNMALAGALFWSRASKSTRQATVSGAQQTEVTIASDPAVTRERNASPGKAKDWFESLREAAVPEKLIAAVAVAKFEEDWTQRRDELQRRFDRGEVDGEAMKLFHLQHDAEEEKVLRAAVGDAGFRHWDQARLLRDYQIAGMNLSEKDTDALYALRKETEQQRRALAAAVAKGEIDEATLEKKTEEARVRLSQGEKDILGEEAYAKISGSDAPQGDLKRALAAMNSTASQAEAVLQAEQEWNQRHSELEQQLQDGKVTSAEFQQQMQALNTTRDSEFARQLGTNGFADLQKAQDNRYQLMEHFAPAWNLDRGEIDSLYSGIQLYDRSSRDYLEQARALQGSGQTVDWSMVEEALRQYSQEMEDYFRKTLGDERFRKLERNHVFTFRE